MIHVDEKQRRWLEKFAEANNGPAWLLTAVRLEDPARRSLTDRYPLLPLTRHKPGA